MNSAKQGHLGATLGFFVGFAAVSLFGPMAKFFEATVGLTPLMAGLLISIPNLSGSLLRIPFAAWVETTGGKKPMVILLGIAIVGMAAIAVMLQQPVEILRANFSLLLIFGACAGAGIATFSVGIGQTSYWFPKNAQGKALGTYAGVGNLAPGIFVLLITNLLLPAFGLKNTYVIWAGFLVLGTLLYVLIARNAWYFQYRKQGQSEEEAKKNAQQDGQELFPTGSVTSSLKISAKIWQTWVLVFVYFLGFGGFLALTVWFPKYWQSFHGLDLKTAGWLTMLYSVGASLVRVAGGSLSDKIGGKKAVNIFLIVTLAGSLLMMFVPSIGLAVFGTILLAVGMGVVNAGVFKLVPHFIPTAVGGAAGWIGGLGAFGGFVIPIVLSAFIAEEGAVSGYSMGFVVFAILSVLSILLVNMVKETKNPGGKK